MGYLGLQRGNSANISRCLLDGMRCLLDGMGGDSEDGGPKVPDAPRRERRVRNRMRPIPPALADPNTYTWPLRGEPRRVYNGLTKSMGVQGYSLYSNTEFRDAWEREMDCDPDGATPPDRLYAGTTGG